MADKRIIIGITGTLGAGKGTIVEHLKKKGFDHYSVRAYLIEEINRRQMPITLDSMIIVANDLRSKYGPSFIVEELYKEALTSASNVIIESIRSVGEVEGLKKLGIFYLISVDAEPNERYQRIIQRQGDQADNLTLEEFLEKERVQMKSSDSTQQSLSQCMLMADFKLINNGTKEELRQKVEKILDKIIGLKI